MQLELDSPEHHRQRSEFIRKLVQNRSGQHQVNARYEHSIPRTIVQFWHDGRQIPQDIGSCIATWKRWEASAFAHRLYDERAAISYISNSLGARHARAFQNCYHPAMQSDYFRLCYLFVEGGCYVDADDVCVGTEIEWLFKDGRLKLQPLCYDAISASMVEPLRFLPSEAGDPSWIFYFNNNPLIAGRAHPIIERALNRATRILEFIDENALPEIQATTGPGNLSRTIFELGMMQGEDVYCDLMVLADWDSFAVSKWPLSHREDSRNWRLSNQKRFNGIEG